MDWPEIQAAAAAAAALEACTSTNSAAGDGSIDSYTAGAMATAFVDGYTFNTVGWRLVDTLDRVVALWEGGVGVPVWCIVLCACLLSMTCQTSYISARQARLVPLGWVRTGRGGCCAGAVPTLPPQHRADFLDVGWGLWSRVGALLPARAVAKVVVDGAPAATAVCTRLFSRQWGASCAPLGI